MAKFPVISGIVTPEFRVSYPAVFVPKKNDMNGKMEYSLVALFPLGADLSKLQKAAMDAAVGAFGPDKTKWPPNLRSPFRDQKERAKIVDGKEIMPDGYVAGAKFLTLKTTNKPGVVDQNLQPILDAEKFYAGCWARADVAAQAYDQKGNRGISFYLNNVQLVRDDDPFSGRRKAEEAFAPIAGFSGGAVDNASGVVDAFLK